MGPWVVGGTAPLLYGEQLGPIGSIQLLSYSGVETRDLQNPNLKPVHGHPGRPRDELQQPGPHLVAEGQDYSPIPLQEYGQ